jgi:hypothetical protein
MSTEERRHKRFRRIEFGKGMQVAHVTYSTGNHSRCRTTPRLKYISFSAPSASLKSGAPRSGRVGRGGGRGGGKGPMAFLRDPGIYEGLPAAESFPPTRNSEWKGTCMTVERGEEIKALRWDGHFRKRSSSTDQQSLTPLSRARNLCLPETHDRKGGKVDHRLEATVRNPGVLTVS